MTLPLAVPITTEGASDSYSEATVSNLTSSIDPSITNLSYRRCHNNGHQGVGKQIPTILFAGFGSSGISEFPDSMTRRMSQYVDPTSGRSPILLKLNLRTNRDYARDTQDAVDLLDHAISSVGSSIYGTSAICIGYSTGALDALLFAARYPDRCLGVILYYPNYDIGLDPLDSYYVLKDNLRSSIAARVQPDGDTRLNPGAASVDQYLARNPINAIGRILTISEAPHIWVFSDDNETETLPSTSRLVQSLESIPEASSKIHAYSSQSGDSLRILHSSGDNSDGAIYAERYYFPYLLKNALEWSIPPMSPSRGLRVLGWIKTRLFELWLGQNIPPKTSANGGLDHSVDLQYEDYSRYFRIDPITATDGYVQIIRDADNYSEAFTAGTAKTINLNISRTISSVSDIGVEHSFRTDLGVTNSSGVTNWADQIGALAFTASSNKPSLTTDSDGKAVIRFSSASSQKLVLNSLLVNPTGDFTLFLVCNKTNSTAQALIECSHHGSLATVGMDYTSGVNRGYAFDDSGNWAISNTNGVGGQVFSQNAKHVLVLMRKSNYLYTSLDGSAWSKSPYTNNSFTLTGTNTTTLGTAWANSGGAYWHFLDGDIYEVDSKQSATSERDIFSYISLMRSRWTF